MRNIVINSSMRKSDFINMKYIMVVFGVILLFNSFFIVGSGERGVVVSATSGTKQISYGEGIHFKVPLIDSATKLEVRTKKYEAEAGSASKDLQIVHTTVAINYHLNPDQVHAVFQTIGKDYENRIINPAIQESVKSTTAKYIAEELITRRELVKEDIKENLIARLDGSNVFVDEVSITNFDFSPEFNKAIEAKVTAEQKALEEQNNLRVVQFQSQQKIASAEGDAEAIRIVNEQLARTPNYIQYYLLQKWDGKLPTALGSNTIFSISQKERE